jgi:nitrile hydratase beta subunit
VNGIHDMGGMQDMGPILRERDEPLFHAEWERRVYALCAAADIDWPVMRRHIELIPPADYLRLSYYERWLVALTAALTKTGVLTPAEVASGTGAVGVPKGWHVLALAEVSEELAPATTAGEKLSSTARFHTGQRVRARNINPVGHTRLPRYVRGKLGTIEHEGEVVELQDMDANGAALGKRPQHVYCVCFTSRELWGEQANVRDAVYVDMWEDYLESA